MPTSTFGKQFFVRAEKQDEFVEEMTKAVTPTLQKNFHSNLAHLSQNQELKNNLVKVLNK